VARGSHRSVPAMPRPVLLSALLALLTTLSPSPSRADEPPEDGEIVAEALFLADTLPPGSHDLAVSVAVEHAHARTLSASPRLQLAAPLEERVGFTVDVGVPSEGGLESPGASLKLLLRDAAADAIGLSASLDVYGSLDRGVDSEVAIVVGALRPLGSRLSLRASALLATGVSEFTPHAQAGFSAALALGARLCALGEVLLDAGGGALTVSAGPAFRLTLGDETSLMAGALFEAGKTALPLFTFQLTRSL